MLMCFAFAPEVVQGFTFQRPAVIGHHVAAETASVARFHFRNFLVKPLSMFIRDISHVWWKKSRCEWKNESLGTSSLEAHDNFAAFGAQCLCNFLHGAYQGSFEQHPQMQAKHFSLSEWVLSGIHCRQWGNESQAKFRTTLKAIL